MPSWQEQLLVKLGDFSWDPHSDRWEHQFRALRTFIEIEGRVPRYRAVNLAERELAAWIHKQRHLHRQDQLRYERLAALRSWQFKIV